MTNCDVAHSYVVRVCNRASAPKEPVDNWDADVCPYADPEEAAQRTQGERDAEDRLGPEAAGPPSTPAWC